MPLKLIVLAVESTLVHSTSTCIFATSQNGSTSKNMLQSHPRLNHWHINFNTFFYTVEALFMLTFFWLAINSTASGRRGAPVSKPQKSNYWQQESQISSPSTSHQQSSSIVVDCIKYYCNYCRQS